eukprot:Amastigsp_a175307_50.p2 type:complete len:146 gc:universal Amastigsp_a175307_50:32-469(+)
MNSVFVIVGSNDSLLFELEHVQRTAPSARILGIAGAAGGDVQTHFLLHAALDVVDMRALESPGLYLKCIDSSHYGDGIDWHTSAYITAGGMRLMLLHDQKNEEFIRNFFVQVHELLVKHMLNPFYKINTPISSAAFEERVLRLLR